MFQPQAGFSPRNWLLVALLLGLYISVMGYRSRDGDQAYRLPILLHMQDRSLYQNDPFVAAFDSFNPHLGYLTLLDTASRTVGLSAALFGTFAITFGLTYIGIRLMTSGVWPDLRPGSESVALVAFGLVLAARSGNIGTNHLFEPTLLDRLLALSMGWCTLGCLISRPKKAIGISPLLILLACLVHPAYGLQMGLLAIAGWMCWIAGGERFGIRRREGVVGLLLASVALLPSLARIPEQSTRLFSGLSTREFLLLSAWVQSPQHMLPHLWRMPQWASWFCYPILALLSLHDHNCIPAYGRRRLASLLFVVLAGLGLAWWQVEVVQSPRAIVFQPFRMATVARGLAVVLIAGRVVSLWLRGDRLSRSRSVLIAVGLTGDWSLVIVTGVELSATLAEWLAPQSRRFAMMIALCVLSYGLLFLSRHDTESGHWRLIAAVGVALVSTIGKGVWKPAWNRRRLAFALALCWSGPGLALVVPNLPGIERSSSGIKVARALVDRWRFGETPRDDIERLAVWCRWNTPIDAVFIGPPGPKTFRLWSRRSLAFNRASGPYHALGLLDWSRRFQAHTAFSGTLDDFVHAYLNNRQELERRYDSLGDTEIAELARRQGAEYVIRKWPEGSSPLEFMELLHVEGHYAVYRLRPIEGLKGSPGDAPHAEAVNEASGSGPAMPGTG